MVIYFSEDGEICEVRVVMDFLPMLACGCLILQVVNACPRVGKFVVAFHYKFLLFFLVIIGLA